MAATTTSMDSYPMAPDSEWPEAWLMSESIDDQSTENRRSPNVPVFADEMRLLGICYWKMPDVDKYNVSASV